jgi:hypothetical protein
VVEALGQNDRQVESQHGKYEEKALHDVTSLRVLRVDGKSEIIPAMRRTRLLSLFHLGAASIPTAEIGASFRDLL